MALIYEGKHLIFKVSGMGPYDNNGYVIADPKTKEAYLVDAPEGIESLLTEASSFSIKGLIITHTHPDHVACLLYTSPSPRDGLLSRMPSSA